jgi:hypothetical protein
MTDTDKPRIWPRRPRTPGLSDAGLDDLFRFEDSEPVRPKVGPQPWLVRSFLITFATSAVVYTAFHIFDLAPSYVLIFAVCAGGVLVRQAARLTAEPTWRRTRDAVRGPRPVHRIEPGGWYEGGDGVIEAVRRWHRRLEWGIVDPHRFAATVGLRLREQADERLRLRHGITTATNPARARTLLGEEVWTLLHPDQPRVPAPREVAAAIRRLESL